MPANYQILSFNHLQTVKGMFALDVTHGGSHVYVRILRRVGEERFSLWLTQFQLP